MTTEEIKLIIEAVSTTTGDARAVLITWFCVDLAKCLFGLIGVLGSIWVLVKGIGMIIQACSQQANWLEQIRDAAVPNQQGTQVSRHEIKLILKTISNNKQP